MSQLIDTHVHMENLHERRELKLRSLLNKRHRETAKRTKNAAWAMSAYDLQEVQLFQNLREDLQELVLDNLSQDRIEEAYHIEKSGMAYGAKMTLLSETLDERELYAFFTGDEARHFEMISRHLRRKPSQGAWNPFLKLLGSMIEHAPKKSLVFMIQVLLEGWGMSHYSEMADECLDEELKANLKSILADECGHHGSGLILFNERDLDREEKEYIQTSLKTFLEMVQVGPAGVMARVLEQRRSFEKKHVIQSLEEMRAEESTQKKLNQLKHLMKKAGAVALIDEMESHGLFTAFDIERMAASF